MKARSPGQMRPVKIERYPTAAPGSVMITQGQTRVLCTASLDELPKWMKAPSEPKPGSGSAEPARGWVTAEYAMLPGSTPQRKKRGTDSRGTEIQRLIGRSLRAAVDLTKIPNLSIACDCDVLVADGGTRAAAITGSYVALADCLAFAAKKGLVTADALAGRGPIAAISVGIIDGKPTLDLDYPLDSRAEADLNVVMDARGRFIEVQGTAEKAAFSRKELDALLDLAAGGIRKLIAAQRRVLAESR
ncbi:MAG: ribonuclease PH [Planctomycetota bacterium]|nr:ribonuclease PH [Planctomycetota bacterium]